MNSELDNEIVVRIMGWPDQSMAFHPSTQIRDAWMVVEKMIAQGWEVSEAGYSRSLKKWDFTFGNGCSFPGPLCDTAPEAICRAALAAVGPD